MANIMRAILVKEFGTTILLDFISRIHVFFLSIGDASVCKLVKDVSIPEVKPEEV